MRYITIHIKRYTHNGDKDIKTKRKCTKEVCSVVTQKEISTITHFFKANVSINDFYVSIENGAMLIIWCALASRKGHNVIALFPRTLLLKEHYRDPLDATSYS